MINWYNIWPIRLLCMNRMPRRLVIIGYMPRCLVYNTLTPNLYAIHLEYECMADHSLQNNPYALGYEACGVCLYNANPSV